MRKIDCHNHPDWQGQDMAAFVAEMDALDIARCWMLSWICPEDEYDPVYQRRMTPLDGADPAPLSRVLAYAEAYPERFIAGYCPDPRRPDAIRRLEAAVSIHRVRVCGELKLRMMYDNPDALALYRRAGELGLPVLVHLDYPLPSAYPYPRPNYWYGGGIDAFERALEACPDTTFIGHAPGFWAHIADDGDALRRAYPNGPVARGGRIWRLLERYPRLYCDLSGFSGLNAMDRDHGHARDFLTTWQDRVLYGRDDVGERHAPLLDGLGLDDAVLAKLYVGNAERLVPSS